MAPEISGHNHVYLPLWCLMKEMIEVHTRVERLRQILVAVAHKQHAEIIQQQQTPVWKGQGCTLKTVSSILNSHVMNS